MKLSLIKERIDFYETNRNFVTGLFSDPIPIANLKNFAASLAPEAKEGKAESKKVSNTNRDLTVAEICRLYTTVLLPAEQRPASEATNMALNGLKSAAGDHYRFCLMLNANNLVNEANLTALSAFPDVAEQKSANTPFETVRRTWTFIPPELRNQGAFDMVMQNGPYLEVLSWDQRNRDEFKSDMENALAERQNANKIIHYEPVNPDVKLAEAKASPESALEIGFMRLMLSYYEHKLGASSLNKIPQILRTRANLERLANLHIEMNSRYNYKYGQFDKTPITFRERIVNAASELPAHLQTQDNLNLIFDKYDYSGIIKDDFKRLPGVLQTSDNLRSLLYNPKYLYGISAGINKLPPSLQTKENFNHLVTAINMVSRTGMYGVEWLDENLPRDSRAITQADVNKCLKGLRAHVKDEYIDNNDLPSERDGAENKTEQKVTLPNAPEKEYKSVVLTSSGVLSENTFDIEEEQALSDALIASLSTTPPASSLSIDADFSNGGANEIKAAASPHEKVDFSNMEDTLTCIITGYIYRDPVTLLSNEPGMGGQTFEENAAKDMIDRGQTNPIDRSVISGYVTNYLAKALVTDFIALNPEAASRIYKDAVHTAQLSPQIQTSSLRLGMFSGEYDANKSGEAKVNSQPPSPSSSNSNK